MPIPVNVYVGDERVTLLQMHEGSPFTPVIIDVAQNSSEYKIVDVTGLDLVPAIGSKWNGSYFSEPYFPNRFEEPIMCFAFVKGDVCVFRHDVHIEHQPHLIAAYRSGVRFEVLDA